MNKSLIVAMALLLGSAGQALAAASCPSRGPDEAIKPFRGRTHDFCEIKWQGLSVKPAGASHDTYINICARDCYKAVGQSAQNLGAQFAGNQIGLVSGLAAAGAVAGVGAAATSGSTSPASP